MSTPLTKSLDCGGRRLVLDRPRIMGILNVTPDSFSDGGRWADAAGALGHAQRMAAAGADIIDVGGESTRPGAEPVGLQEELDRTIPVIEALQSGIGLPVSIDTSKPDVMRAAAGAGAGMINDVFALRQEGALQTAAELGLPVCLMHLRGEPRSMQADPRYDDVTAEVEGFLLERARVAIAAGIHRERILLDPGFGFGKNLQHNLELMRQLPRLASHGFPVLAGLSRKSMLLGITGREIPERLAGSVALALLAVMGGASIVRVHDVAETRDALKVLEQVWPTGRAEE